MLRLRLSGGRDAPARARRALSGLNGSLAGLGHRSPARVRAGDKRREARGAGPRGFDRPEARRLRGMVRVEVRDDGPGFEPPPRRTEPGTASALRSSTSSPTAGASSGPGAWSGSRSTGGPRRPAALGNDDREADGVGRRARVTTRSRPPHTWRRSCRPPRTACRARRRRARGRPTRRPTCSLTRSRGRREAVVVVGGTVAPVTCCERSSTIGRSGARSRRPERSRGPPAVRGAWCAVRARCAVSARRAGVPATPTPLGPVAPAGPLSPSGPAGPSRPSEPRGP